MPDPANPAALLHVLAAGAPSKAPFYLLGGLLAAWAVVLSAIGLSRPGFPESPGRARAVMGLSALLVAATMVTAVATASRPTKQEGREQPAGASQTGQASPPQGQLGGASGGGPSPARAGGAVQVAADPSGQLAYQQKALSARAGKVTIQFTNQSPLPHDVTIESGGRRIGGTRQISQSKTTATVPLRPGTYTFYCSVDSHRQAGMHGTLAVS
ncbi:MAG: plastocyanin/azurin family copper-binding protein [Solirubrobacteraceae bacterium]|jgi:plastocyanin